MLTPTVKLDNPITQRRAVQRLSSLLDQTKNPKFSSIILLGLTATRLVQTDADKTLASVTDLTNWIAGTTNRVTVTDDGDGTLTLTLPQDYHTAATPTLGGLTLVNAITEFSTDDTLGDNSDSAVPTEQAVKAYVDGAVSASSQYSFKTITGITSDVVADATDDTLTLASANARLTIVGTAGTDTITFTADTNLHNYSWTNVDATDLKTGSVTQAYDAGLTSLAGLTYASDSFIKVTATDTYAIRTIAETKTDLSLNLVENTALSTWAGSTNITTLGTIATVGNITIANGGTIGQAAGPLLTFNDTGNILGIAGCDVNISKSVTANTTGIIDVTLTTGNDFAGSYAVAAEFTAKNTGSVGVSANLTGFCCTVQQAGSGTISLGRGGSFNVYNTHATGTITTVRTLDVNNPYFSSTGTIGTLYGLYIAAQSHAQVTTAYSIYQTGASDKNYFAGNTGIGQTTFGTNATKTLALSTGVAPTSSPANCFQMYSADIVAGHAAAHIRNENDTIIKLYQQAHIVDVTTQDLAGTDTIDEAKLESDLAGIVAAINALYVIFENNGLLASA